MMLTTKLTLSASSSIIEAAKQTAASQHTSVSKMFSRFIQAMQVMPAIDSGVSPEIGSITKRASGLLKLPDDKSDSTLIEEALSSHYGVS